jgi:hypothetical protein
MEGQDRIVEVAPGIFAVDIPHISPMTLAHTCGIDAYEEGDEEADWGGTGPLESSRHNAVTSTRLICTVEQLNALHVAMRAAVGANVVFENVTPEEEK